MNDFSIEFEEDLYPSIKNPKINRFNKGDQVIVKDGWAAGEEYVVVQQESSTHYPGINEPVYLIHNKEYSDILTIRESKLCSPDEYSAFEESKKHNNEAIKESVGETPLFEVGSRVKIVSGRGEGKSGVVVECGRNSDPEIHVVLDGESRDDERIYYHYNLLPENASEEYMESVKAERVVSKKKVRDKSYFMESGYLPAIMNYPHKHDFEMLIMVESCKDNTSPHFHVFKSLEDRREMRNGAVFSMTENSYFSTESNNEKLSKEELLGLTEYLSVENPDDPGKTMWETLIETWNYRNPDGVPLDISIPCPEYDKM